MSDVTDRTPVALALLGIALLPLPAAAQVGGDSDGAFSVIIENDRFGGTDRNYTNGFQIDYLTPPRPAAGMAATALRWLPGNEGGEARVGWQLGQQIFTPQDTESEELLPNDRPYAGWLYAGVSSVYSTDNHIDTWLLQIGTVGPDAYGEEVQNSFHDLIDSENVNGWDNQLDNQVGGMLIIERKWRAVEVMSMNSYGFDVLPHVGLSLGNIEQYANAGFTLRFGKDLDNDFGPPRIRPSLPGTAFFVPHDRWSWYLHAGIDGRYVDRNIFLDDNDQADLFNITKKDWVGDAQAGLVVTRRGFRLAFTFVYRTEQFDLQEGADQFGSLAFTWRL